MFGNMNTVENCLTLFSLLRRLVLELEFDCPRPKHVSLKVPSKVSVLGQTGKGEKQSCSGNDSVPEGRLKGSCSHDNPQTGITVVYLTLLFLVLFAIVKNDRI